MNQGTLYIVATPIGNLGDMSPRAVETLREVNLIAAEDTRHSRKLLSHFQFSTPLLSYHEHNQARRDDYLLEKLETGESIALVSDAGVPGISDPGETLVQKAIKRGIPVIPIPGPSAVLCALVASGLSMQPFTFIGFLPRTTSERRQILDSWSSTPSTLVFYESPHRIEKMLKSCLEVLGDRQVAVGRELTKKNEEWLRGSLSEVIQAIEEKGVRGEYTVVIEGGTVSGESEEEAWWSELSLTEHVEKHISEGHSKKDAIALVSSERKVPKKEVYNTYHRGLE